MGIKKEGFVFFYTITYAHTYRRAGETTRYVPSPLPNNDHLDRRL